MKFLIFLLLFSAKAFGQGGMYVPSYVCEWPTDRPKLSDTIPSSDQLLNIPIGSPNIPLGKTLMIKDTLYNIYFPKDSIARVSIDGGKTFFEYERMFSSSNDPEAYKFHFVGRSDIFYIGRQGFKLPFKWFFFTKGSGDLYKNVKYKF